MLQPIITLAASALLACQIITPAPVTKSAQSIKTHLNQPALVNWIALGDSNTQGNPGYGVNSVDQALTYPALVGAINEGVSGNRVDQVTARLNTSLFSRYKKGYKNVVTLLIGINNFNQGWTVSDTWRDLQTLTDKITSNGWELTVMTYIPHQYNAQVTAQVVELNQLIRANRGKYKVLDLYYHIRAEHMTVDGLHLNQDGHAKIAELLQANSSRGQEAISFKSSRI